LCEGAKKEGEQGEVETKQHFYLLLDDLQFTISAFHMSFWINDFRAWGMGHGDKQSLSPFND
jgi:hypothetical protein